MLAVLSTFNAQELTEPFPKPPHWYYECFIEFIDEEIEAGRR